MKPLSEYEVNWTMLYDAESAEDAVRQALAHFAEIAADPSQGPNIFVVSAPASVRYIFADTALVENTETE